MNCKLAWRLCGLIVVWTLVLLMSLDTAFACRVLARWRAYRTCYVPCQVCCHHIRETTCCGVPIEKTEPTCHGSDSPAEPTVNSNEDAAAAEPTTPSGTDTAELPESEPTPVDEPPASDSPSEIAESADPAPVEQEPVEENDDASLADEVKSTEPEVPVEEVAEEIDPADEPAEENDDVNDLFGDVEEAVEQTPAEEQPAEENDVIDDLFGDVEEAVEQTPAEEQPATEEQPVEENDDVDDLFGAPEESAESTPAVEEPAETTDDKDQKAKDDLDDIFGQRHSINKLKTTVASVDTDNPPKIRRWVDNTGLYSTVGRLVLVMPGAVRILKDNGRYTTVATNRLSSVDLDYVDQMDHQHGSNLRGRWAMAR